MPGKPYSPRVVQAMELMYQLHKDQVRKGAGVPYITHLLAVAALVGEYGGDEDQFIAALLHDAVEDAGGQPVLEEIRRLFGERVARMVWACSDTDVMPKPPWRARKEAFIAAVAEAPEEVRLIIAADKLHNVRSLVLDLRRMGCGVWSRFSGGEEGSLWAYGALLGALSEGWEHPILLELREAMEQLNHCATQTKG